MIRYILFLLIFCTSLLAQQYPAGFEQRVRQIASDVVSDSIADLGDVSTDSLIIARDYISGQPTYGDTTKMIKFGPENWVSVDEGGDIVNVYERKKDISIDTISSSAISIDTLLDPIFGLVTGGTYMPAAYRYKGTYDRTYLRMLGWDGYDGYHDRQYVTYWDHDGDSLATPVLVPAHANAWDNHIVGSIIVANDGHVLVFQDRIDDGDGSNNQHNKGIEVFRSYEAESIDSLISLGNVSADKGTYPSAWKTPDGTIHLIHRYGEPSTDHYRVRYHRSTDNGLTWGNHQYIITFGNSEWWAYPRFVTMHPDSQMIGMVVMRLELTGAEYKWWYYLESRDGDTWYNIDSSFSIDVSGGTPISLDSANTYFLIDSTHGASGQNFCRYAVKHDNYLYAVADTCYNKAAYDFDFLFYRISEDGDTTETLIRPAGRDTTKAGFVPFIHPIDSDTIYVMLDWIDTDNDSRFTLYKSTDGGSSFSVFREVFEDTVYARGT